TSASTSRRTTSPRSSANATGSCVQPAPSAAGSTCRTTTPTSIAAFRATTSCASRTGPGAWSTRRSTSRTGFGQSTTYGWCATPEIKQAQQTADGVKLQQAAFAIEEFHALNGTYAASSLGHLGVKLAQADSSSYCLETANEHLTGPGGSPEPGRC